MAYSRPAHEIEADLRAIQAELEVDTRGTKAAAILAGASPQYTNQPTFDGDVPYNGPHFLKAVSDWRQDPEANAWVKAVLGTSVATGLAIVPNNYVASINAINAQSNPYRALMNVETVSGAGPAIDIPYEVTGLQAALLQGAYGSNKDNRDFTLARATATLYTIATIIDISAQLLRQSEGAAENAVRRRLGKYFGLAEGNFIINGTGSSQPLGILPAMLAYGDTLANKYTLNSESRAAAIGNGLAKLESRGERATAVVMNPTDYWEMATETLGTSGSGGWAFDAATGPADSPIVSIWGIPVARDVNLPVGTALVGNWRDCDIFIGQEFRIDVSTEAGNRFDQNLVGYRAEEEFGFNAEPYVRTGKFVKILGL